MVQPPVPIAFYAPMKQPDHPQPSGDRTIARNLLAALAAAGFAPELASTLRAHEKTGDQSTQEAIRSAALTEADNLIARWREAPANHRPRLWFTYHLYDRAPDWIGPRVAQALQIPYVVAEASLTPSRANGRWRLGHAATVAALRQASVILVLNENDRPCIVTTPELADAAMADKCIALPPFLARLPEKHHQFRQPRPARPVQLLAVAMLRHGDKLASFTVLARALAETEHHDWRLTIVGDGPARDAVAALFAPFGAKVSMAGAVLEPQALDAIYAGHDLLVWPAVNEAFGMVLLEAQANGCPVLAGGGGGVSGVLRDGETGWLVPMSFRWKHLQAAQTVNGESPGQPAAVAQASADELPPGVLDFAAAFAAKLDALLASEGATPGFLAATGAAGADFIRSERSLASAAAILRASLTPLATSPGLSSATRPAIGPCTRSLMSFADNAPRDGDRS